MYDLPGSDVIHCNVVTPGFETGGIQRASFGLTVGDFHRLAAAARSPDVAATAPEPAHDHRVYFMCSSCEEHNPEGAVGPRSDIAVMPDGTWLCDGCYSDCDKSAYGMVASDVDDFEFPRFEDLPRPAPYGAQPPAPAQAQPQCGVQNEQAPKPERPKWPVKGDVMTFLGKNGYPFELEAALKIFTPGEKYRVHDCHVGGWSHSIQFDGVKGRFNGVMFELCSSPAPSAEGR